MGSDRKVQADQNKLCRQGGWALDKVRGSDTQRELGEELLLLCIERRQLRWYGFLIAMPSVRFPCLWRPQGRPRTRWRDYIARLSEELLEIPQEELEGVAKERHVWITLLTLLSWLPNPVKSEGNGWMRRDHLILPRNISENNTSCCLHTHTAWDPGCD